MEVSESGFRTKAAALAWGRDQEARMREGRWNDPNAGNFTVSEWIERWLAMQDVGISTVENREYLIRRFLRPAWGASELHSLSTEEITKWENSIPAWTGVSRRVARDARSLLCTILGDAAAAKPPLIPYNPALRPRNRGRRTGRRLERAPQRVWATPLQALLVAERAALLTGRDDDFTMVITIGYTGLRYGETIGLERGYVRQDEIHVEWQLREIGSTFHRIPPKDDSYRSPNWEPVPARRPPAVAGRPAGPADPGPAPATMRLRQPARRQRTVRVPRPRRRPLPAQRLRPPRVPPGLRRGRRDVSPGRPGRLIVTDATIWPGLPVAAWPPAQPGAPFAPPRGRGIQAIPEGTPLASWLPLKPGLTPHGLRHGHKTWMAEDGIPRSSPSRASATRCPGCAASTPTPPTGCATT